MRSIVVLAAVLPALSCAQIVKCVDPRTKAVTYSNSGCAAKDDASLVARKQTHEETRNERIEAAEARARLRSEMAALRAREAEERRAVASRGAVGLGGGGSSGGGGSAAPAGGGGGRSCDQAMADLETRQSSIGRRKTDNDVSALARVQSACGIDASKYMQDPPTIVNFNKGANPGRYEVDVKRRPRGD